MSQVARSTTISKENARSCLEAAGAAYHEDDKTLSCVADGCKVCVTIESERMIIAFRGTDNLENFFTDLDIKLIPYLPGQGHVHQGFFKAFQALQPLLDDVLQPGKILLFTGHSLGGALATLSALHAASASGRSIQCVTFGCPKVGDEDFARFYMQQVPQTCRYVNKFDPVPRLLHNSARPRDDADLFHWMLSKLIKSPQAQLVGGEYAHVCDAVQLDSGAASSVNHWRAVAACVGWLTGRAGEDRRQEAWRKALVPHDVSIYKQNFEQKPSFNFDSMNMKDLQILLQIVRCCPSPMLVAAAAAAGLAILMLWRMKATEAPPELRRWETELQTVADSRSCDASQAQELDLADKEDLCQQLDVLCRATAAAIQAAAPGEGDTLDHLDPWRRLAPLIGRFLWNSSSWPGQWLELLPSIHHFQDLALDMEGEATLAWAPDSFEARVTLAFTERLLRGNQLPEAAHEWFTSYGLLVPELPKCLEALDYDSPESSSRRTAVKTMVALMAEFMHSWPPALLVATLRRINRIAATDSNKEVRDSAAESLAEANSLVGLRPLLSCSQHQDPKLRRHATKLLKDIWEHSLSGPGWVIEELQQLHFDAHYSDAAEEALSYLRSTRASGASMAAPVAD